MPIYEYRCTKGHTFEVMQSVNDEPLTKCQVCGSPVVRVLHAPAVHFKGSGFYNTDYGTRKRQRAASESGSPESTEKSEKAAEKSASEKSSGDSKPAADKTDKATKPASSS